MSASAPTRPDELYKKGQASAAPSAPASAGGSHCGVGGPGDGLIAFGATMYRCALPAQVQLGGYRPDARALRRDLRPRRSTGDLDTYRGKLLPSSVAKVRPHGT